MDGFVYPRASAVRWRRPRAQFPMCGDREPPLEAKAEGRMVARHFTEEG
jgi:hypothetical protein